MTTDSCTGRRRALALTRATTTLALSWAVGCADLVEGALGGDHHGEPGGDPGAGAQTAAGTPVALECARVALDSGPTSIGPAPADAVATHLADGSVAVEATGRVDSLGALLVVSIRSGPPPHGASAALVYADPGVVPHSDQGPATVTWVPLDEGGWESSSSHTGGERGRLVARASGQAIQVVSGAPGGAREPETVWLKVSIDSGCGAAESEGGRR